MSSDAAQYFPSVVKEGVDDHHAGVEKSSISRTEPSEKTGPITDTSLPVASPVPSTEPSDAILLEGICRGNKEALAQLFRRYAQMIRAVAYRILRDRAEADDLLQEVFLFINRKCEVFDSAKGSARSWIVQMTYHRAIDRRRYLVSRHFYTQVDIDDPTMDVADPRSDVLPYEQSMEGVLGKAGLEKMKQLLSQDQLTTLRLYFFEGQTLDEIAVHLGQSVGNVKHHYYRGLEAVRRRMLAKKLRVD